MRLVILNSTQKSSAGHGDVADCWSVNIVEEDSILERSIYRTKTHSDGNSQTKD